MAFEFRTSAGTVRLAKTGRAWSVQYAGKKRGRWHPPDAAGSATVHNRTGAPPRDDPPAPFPQDIIGWRPLGHSIQPTLV
jgi:hypothetical protein